MSHASLSRTVIALSAFFVLCAQAAGPNPSGSPRKPTSVKFHKAPSEESPAAREKRLQRECKGRANAGMCLGYTR
ncbi:hypothetical protein BSY239_3857 [Hydrogenophaga sp. RAC07]|uniref:hypothetical protein n=1 Tax=Hydrogenophaga sp. RAC07 TaxID=1842537 RepID=UPI00083E35D2|nr:hypothetical protein [Hydrogenophaga sp. RAC07]AOF86275.1 hypothetical protein BSY239_3857 [Hydrogenophaga sp. RAC07]